jgi:HSP20 family protein
MSNLIRWNPFRELGSASEPFNRWLDEAFTLPGFFSHTEMPRLDVVEKDAEIVVTAELPGFAPENIDVRVEGDVLTLRGEVKTETKEEKGNGGKGQYHVHERRMSTFVRSVRLPTSVNTEKSSAEFENGVLTLTLPKREDAKANRITIKAKSSR